MRHLRTHPLFHQALTIQAVFPERPPASLVPHPAHQAVMTGLTHEQPCWCQNQSFDLNRDLTSLQVLALMQRSPPWPKFCSIHHPERRQRLEVPLDQRWLHRFQLQYFFQLPDQAQLSL